MTIICIWLLKLKPTTRLQVQHARMNALHIQGIAALTSAIPVKRLADPSLEEGDANDNGQQSQPSSSDSRDPGSLCITPVTA